MNDFSVDVQHLNKSFGSLKAVNDISFQVKPGKSFGLLGLNGAGKTTTFKMMVSLIKPDSGTALVAGYDVVKEPMRVRANIGYVAENPAFYTRMSTYETLRYVCRLLGISMTIQDRLIDSVLELVGLMDKKDAYVGGFSRGMRHRLGLAQALLAQPQVLFLDEPTLGLDPLGAKSMRDLIIRLRQEREVTVLMSSHVLPEVEAICDEVAIFDHGNLIAVDTIENLRHTSSDNINMELVMAQANEQVVQKLREIPGVNKVDAHGSRLDINVWKKSDLRPGIIQEAVSNNAQILSFGIKESSLEDILLRLVQTDASDLDEGRGSGRKAAELLRKQRR